MALPMTVLFQVLGHMFRDQDMPSVTTIHHSLRDVDSSSSNVGATTYVHHAADRSAVHPHPDLQLDLFLNFARHLFDYNRSRHGCLYSFGMGEAASFWKRGSFRSGSNMGSSRSTAGVSGMPTANEPPLGIESSF